MTKVNEKRCHVCGVYSALIRGMCQTHYRRYVQSSAFKKLSTSTHFVKIDNTASIKGVNIKDKNI